MKASGQTRPKVPIPLCMYVCMHSFLFIYTQFVQENLRSHFTEENTTQGYYQEHCKRIGEYES